MRIACDLDGVLADLHTPFSQAALRMFPDLDRSSVAPAEVGASPPDQDGEEEVSAEDNAAAAVGLPLSRSQTAAVWRQLTAIEDFWETLDEHEAGLIAKLANLVEQQRWEIIFITSRPRSKGRIIQHQSQRWLQRHGFPTPSVFVVHGSRGRVADALALDIVIDDRPDNCLDVVLESRAGALLVWRGTRGAVPASAKRMGIAVVPSVAACLDALVEAERTQQGGGLLDRLRSIFGLKTKPAGPFKR